MKLVGIDGCRAGWVVATSDMALGSLEFSIERDLTALFNEAEAGRCLVAIDVPIGLPSGGRSHRGVRACDEAARKLLGAPRSSSVFPAPCRATLEVTFDPQAPRIVYFKQVCAANFAVSGKNVTFQLVGILQKIAQVDLLMTRERQDWIREAHPEVTFALLPDPPGVQVARCVNGRGLVSRKNRDPGRQERLALLRPFFPHFDPLAVRADLRRSEFGLVEVKKDDILDAVACLVTAGRVVAGQARVLPADRVQLDARGLRMEIVA